MPPNAAVPATGRKNSKHFHAKQSEKQADIFARRKKAITKPKKNLGKATCKRQSECTNKTAKFLHPKKTSQQPQKKPTQPRRIYEEPNITVDDLRMKVLKAVLDSKGKLTDPAAAMNTPIYVLLKNYRKLSTDNPKYLDHYQLVYKFYKKQYDHEVGQSTSRRK